MLYYQYIHGLVVIIPWHAKAVRGTVVPNVVVVLLFLTDILGTDNRALEPSFLSLLESYLGIEYLLKFCVLGACLASPQLWPWCPGREAYKASRYRISPWNYFLAYPTLVTDLPSQRAWPSAFLRIELTMGLGAIRF